MIDAIQNRPIRGGNSQLTEAVLSDGTGKLRLTWFNRPWITNQYHKNDQVVVSGKLDQYLGRLVMNAPEIEELEKELRLSSPAQTEARAAPHNGDEG